MFSIDPFIVYTIRCFLNVHHGFLKSKSDPFKLLLPSNRQSRSQRHGMCWVIKQKRASSHPRGRKRGKMSVTESRSTGKNGSSVESEAVTRPSCRALKNVTSLNHEWNFHLRHIFIISRLLCLPDSLRQPQSPARGGAPLAGVGGAVHRPHPQPLREHAPREEVPAHHDGVVGVTSHPLMILRMAPYLVIFST